MKTVKEIRLSHSRMSSFVSCPQKFEYNYIYENPAWEQDGFAAGLGTAFHTFAQEYMLHKDFTVALWKALMDFPFHLYDDTGIWKAKKDYGRTWQNLVRSCERFAEMDLHDRYELVKFGENGEIPAIEATFECDLGIIEGAEVNYHFLYEGHIDMILKDKYTRTLYPVDIKTFTAEGTEEQYDFPDQMVMYAIATKHMMEDNAGVVAMDTEYVAKYWFMRMDVVEPKFSEKISMKSESIQLRFFQNLHYVCEQIATMSEKRWFFTNRNNCFAWKTRCKFADMCGVAAPRQEIQDWILSGKEAKKTTEAMFKFKLELM